MVEHGISENRGCYKIEKILDVVETILAVRASKDGACVYHCVKQRANCSV